MYLRAQVIDNDNIVVGRVRRSCRLSNNNGGINRERVIDDASEASETTMEEAGAR